MITLFMLPDIVFQKNRQLCCLLPVVYYLINNCIAYIIDYYLINGFWYKAI